MVSFELIAVDPNVVRIDVFETYCWVHGTFTVPSQYSGKRDMGHRIYSTLGCGSIQADIHIRASDRRKAVDEASLRTQVMVKSDKLGETDLSLNKLTVLFFFRYQWVVVVVFFQAFAFYAPHVIWR